jgi:hypothetical protein
MGVVVRKWGVRKDRLDALMMNRGMCDCRGFRVMSRWVGRMGSKP